MSARMVTSAALWGLSLGLNLAMLVGGWQSVPISLVAVALTVTALAIWPWRRLRKPPLPVAEVEAGGVIEGVTFYGNVRIGAGSRLTNVTIKPRRTR